MNNSMPVIKKSIQPVLVDRERLRKALHTIKQDSSSWVWKLCMYEVMQAYGVKCDAPLPEIGDRHGNYICTYVNKETGEYAFIRERSLLNRSVRVCQQIANRGFYVAS
ncbi:hypothetical protein ABQ397_24290 [Serratia fonticola]|uniref:hypothetical protein n=1 Tax=Serratia fonticola TaxID=47917 RepID=UPI003AAAA966